jgi:KipI family sensor histidine kinase inhibitor
MRLRPVGDAAILAELDEPGQVLPFAEAVNRQRPTGVIDVVPAERTVLVCFDPGRARSAAIAHWLRGLSSGSSSRLIEGPQVQLDVHYDGEDLAEVARLTGLSEAGVVAAHTGQEWVVAFSGFAPGFGYLRPASRPASRPTSRPASSGPEALEVPRRDEPRVRVPAGSVALAAGYTGVYPRTSPGGWQLIGRTAASVWDVDRDPPALLRPGVRVRFRELPGGA